MGVMDPVSPGLRVDVLGAGGLYTSSEQGEWVLLLWETGGQGEECVHPPAPPQVAKR